MSTTQHDRDVNQVGCVDMLLTMVHLRVLLLILINFGGWSIVTSPVISNPNRPISATLKVSEIRYRQRDTKFREIVTSDNNRFPQTSPAVKASVARDSGELFVRPDSACPTPSFVPGFHDLLAHTWDEIDNRLIVCGAHL